MKVLYMSGYAADVIAARDFAGIPHTLLAKPFAPDVLAAKVREALGPPRLSATVLVVDDEPACATFLSGFSPRPALMWCLPAMARRRYEGSPRASGSICCWPPTYPVMPEQEGLGARPDTAEGAARSESRGRILARSAAARQTEAEVLGADATLLNPRDPRRSGCSPRCKARSREARAGLLLAEEGRKNRTPE